MTLRGGLAIHAFGTFHWQAVCHVIRDKPPGAKISLPAEFLFSYSDRNVKTDRGAEGGHVSPGTSVPAGARPEGFQRRSGRGAGFPAGRPTAARFAEKHGWD